ncbi:hypothetical protein [Cellvibrio sp. QJXJ]|uniref:hypothetical protein n=1 Tax=Cellvibrio sp. QJXJ TaxID=2964606 RepID=UPI0021C2A3DE|nr:hypothetical protein [Cellvibrio sp. QJXJ]UUA71122.1 hypothetical protein NNX04_11950 [Cellvibrio sp. QJXJ]
MLKFVILFSFLVCVSAANAAVKCDLEKIKGLQVKQNGDIYYVSDSGLRRKVAAASNPNSANIVLQSLTLALDKRLYVQASFPDTYDCKAPNDVLADWVYVQTGNI